MKLQHSAINILDLVIIYTRFAKTQSQNLPLYQTGLIFLF